MESGEYWIVDPDARSIRVMTLEGSTYSIFGEYEVGDKLTSPTLKGLRLEVEGVFAAPGQPSAQGALGARVAGGGVGCIMPPIDTGTDSVRRTQMAKSNGKTYAGEDFGDLKQAAIDHLWMPFSQYNDLLSKGGPKIIVEGDGIRMTDSDGNSYIDAIGGLFLVNVGHGRTKIAEAVADQLSAVPLRQHLHVSRPCRPSSCRRNWPSLLQET